MTPVTTRVTHFTDRSPGGRWLSARVVEKDKASDWRGGGSPRVTLEWMLDETDANGRAKNYESLHGLTVAEAKVLLKCLRSALRHVEDIENGETD